MLAAQKCLNILGVAVGIIALVFLTTSIDRSLNTTSRNRTINNIESKQLASFLGNSVSVPSDSLVSSIDDSIKLYTPVK